MPASCQRLSGSSRRSAPFCLPSSGLSACGGIPGDAVVQVDGTPITKNAFDHWMTVAAASSATAPAEKPVVPEPPELHGVHRALAATAPKPAKGQKAPTTAQLKTECEQQYKSLQSEVLGFLISSQWVLGEANVAGRQAHRRGSQEGIRRKSRTQQFPKAAEFEKFLATSGQTVSDLLLRVKLNLLSQKIQKKIIKEKSNVTRSRRSPSTTTKTSPSTARRKSATCRIILTKTEAAGASAKKEIESGKSFASVAKQGLDRPDQQGQRRPAQGSGQRRGGEGARRRRSSRPEERARRARQDAVRLLHLRSREHHAPAPSSRCRR